MPEPESDPDAGNSDVQQQTETLNNHLNVLSANWDDLNGRDSIVSVKDLHKEVNDPDNSPELGEAIQYLIHKS